MTILARHEAAGDTYWAIRVHLMKLLADADVKTLTNTRISEINDKGVAIVSDGKRSMLEADTIVLAVGLKPNRRLFETLKDSGLEIYAIGDCVKPRRVFNAIWRAFHIARRI